MSLSIHPLEYNNIIYSCIYLFTNTEIITNIYKDIEDKDIRKKIICLHNKYLMNCQNDLYKMYSEESDILFIYIKLMVKLILQNHYVFNNKLMNYYEILLENVSNNICDEYLYIETGILLKNINKIILFFKDNKNIVQLYDKNLFQLTIYTMQSIYANQN